MEGIFKNLIFIGPLTILSWFLVVYSTKKNPQKLRNSFLLMNAIFWTFLFIAALFGKNMGYALVYILVFIYFILFSVPVLLILNGVIMLKREGKSLANILSLLLGLGIGIGEIALAIYVFVSSSNLFNWHFNRFFLFVGISVFYFSFIILSFVLYTIFVQILPHKTDVNYIIIHGCGLKKDGSVSNILKARCDKAIHFFHKCNDKPIIIPSGGQGMDEVISEAQSMENYLVSKNIPLDKILQENKSTTTMENLIYSKEIIENRKGAKKVALVTSNYHVYRCLTYAKEVKLKNCIGIGSSIAFYYWPSALLRECVAIFSKRDKLAILFGGYAFLVCAILWR